MGKGKVLAMSAFTNTHGMNSISDLYSTKRKGNF